MHGYIGVQARQGNTTTDENNCNPLYGVKVVLTLRWLLELQLEYRIYTAVTIYLFQNEYKL